MSAADRAVASTLVESEPVTSNGNINDSGAIDEAIIGFAGIVGAIGLAGRRRHRRVAVVASELRHRRLYVSMPLRNDLSHCIAGGRLPRR